jgi:hypothetical protein
MAKSSLFVCVGGGSILWLSRRQFVSTRVCETWQDDDPFTKEEVDQLEDEEENGGGQVAAEEEGDDVRHEDADGTVDQRTL